MERRHFLMSTAAVAGSTALASPNDTIRVATVGIRGRGGSHIKAFTTMPNVELAALCDIDESVLNKRAGEVESATGKKPALYTDIRKVLEDKSIDAISIATPNHSHTLQTIWSVQAGKDVYVEKPCTHNIFEAKQIVAATRKYNRIVQHGSQSRSSAACQEAVQKLREGAIGDVYMGRGLCYKWRDTIGRQKPEPVPAGVHYDEWLGPAPKREFTRNRFHYNWHWHWDYGNGDIGNQGIHQMDVARWGLGVKYPFRVSSMGGHFMFDDDQETPNTQVAMLEFNEAGKHKLMVFEVRHWITNGESTVGGRGPGNAIGELFYGSKGYMSIGGGYQTFLGKEQEPGPKWERGRGGESEGGHFGNFIAAMRSRKPSELTAEIEEGSISTVLMHLANISYRLGRTLNFDAESMTCKGDSEANKMFTRNYRAPYVVPAKV
jgi:predicted dehydrogenase